VFSSSCTVYGEPSGNFEVDEYSPIGKPASPYGQTKVMGEQIIHDVCRANPLFNALNLRYFNPVGAHPSAAIGEFPQGKPSNLLPYITQTAIGKLAQLTVFGGDYNTLDGTCLRDYIHVCDLAEAHVKGFRKQVELEYGRTARRRCSYDLRQDRKSIQIIALVCVLFH